MSSSGQIVNLVNPTNAQDAATKSYVDTKTTDMATNASVTNALGSSGTQENRPTVLRGDTDSAWQYLTFINDSDFPSSNGSNKRALMRCDGNLYYKPSTNTLYAETFSGTATYASSAGSAGSASTATSSSYANNGIYDSTNGWVLYNNSGRIGIGTTGPVYPLDVKGLVHYNGSNVRFLNWVNFGVATFTWGMSIQSQYGILVGADMVFSSDKRIKKNVKDIDGNTALSQIRQIRPKIYNYIDNRTKGTADVYGFIAQDVKDVILHSTMCTKDYIPNFYSMGKISILDASNHIYEISSENELSFEKVIDDSGNEVIFHKVKFYGYDNTEYICSLIQVNNLNNIVVKLEKEYKFANDEENKYKIFIYGQEIYDFYNLEKNAVWTIATAALQEVDRQQQADKVRIAELEATVATQQSLINDILERLKALERT